MDPATIAAVGLGLYFFLRRSPDGGDTGADEAPPRTKADPRDIAPGQDADPTQGHDPAQRTRLGAVVESGAYTDGQTIQTYDAIPFAAFFGARSAFTIHSPMASGVNAPLWGACGMPAATARFGGRAILPAQLSKQIKQSITSDYPSCQAPRKKGRKFSGVVARPIVGGRAPFWLPQDSALHARYGAGGGSRANPGIHGRMPDAGPQEGDLHGGRLRRLRGVRTEAGVPLVLAEDSVNFSSINLSASGVETERGDQFRLFIGAHEWTALQISRGGTVTQLSRVAAERRLAWVVPGMLHRVKNSNDRSVRTMRPRIVGADGRAGSRNPWEIAPFSGFNVQDPFALAADDIRLRFTLGALGEPGRRLFFAPSAQNLIHPARAWFCTGVSKGWTIAHPFTVKGDCTSEAEYSTPNLANRPINDFPTRFGGPDKCRGQDPCEGRYGPYYWARGTASQYHGTADRNPDRRPMIPFSLEAPLLLRAVISRQYVRVIADEV